MDPNTNNNEINTPSSEPTAQSTPTSPTAFNPESVNSEPTAPLTPPTVQAEPLPTPAPDPDPPVPSVSPAPDPIEATNLPSANDPAKSENPPPPVTGMPHRRRSRKVFVVALLAILLIGGGSAAAYFGVILPNKPENVLKTAIANSLQARQVSFNGTLNLSTASDGGIASKIDLNGAENTIAKAADVQLKVTISGVPFPIEGRLVNKNAYVKVGDLTPLVSLANNLSPSLGPSLTKINSQLANKWILFDSTLLDESGVSCVLNNNWSLSKSDINLLEKQYQKAPFATIQNTSNDTINGKPAEKFQLSLDDDKGAKYLNSLSSLSIAKAANKCQKSTASAYKSLADHDHTTLAVWVNKNSKQIVQVAGNSTAKDASKGNVKADAKVTFDYKPVSIAAPVGAVPAVQVLTQLFGGTPAGSGALNFQQ